MFRYLVAAWAGFAAGQVVGWFAGWEVWMLGQVHMLEGTLGSVLLLFIMSWLAASP